MVHPTELSHAHLPDGEVLALALASDRLTPEGRRAVGAELQGRGLVPDLAAALVAPQAELTPEAAAALVTRTRARPCPICGGADAPLTAHAVGDLTGVEAAGLGVAAAAGVLVVPVQDDLRIEVGCPECLKVPASAEPAPELLEVVQARRHLLTAFEGRPDLIDAVLADNPALLHARLVEPPGEDWQRSGDALRPVPRFVAILETDDEDEAMAAFHDLGAANLSTSVQAGERDGAPWFEVLVPGHQADLAVACLGTGEEASGAFCFHCGAAVAPEAETCPECGGDLREG
jgi:hypothetical protein